MISDGRRSCPVGVPRRRPQHILLYEYKQDLQRTSISCLVDALEHPCMVQPPNYTPALIYSPKEKRQYQPSAPHLVVLYLLAKYQGGTWERTYRATRYRPRRRCRRQPTSGTYSARNASTTPCAIGTLVCTLAFERGLLMTIVFAANGTA